jgi:prepilin-type processing-associated H-X9-DG protein
MKQTGLAVHNFHGANDALPPLIIYNAAGSAVLTPDNPRYGRLSFWGLIYPYNEQLALYDKVMEGTGANAGFDRVPGQTWWRTVLNESDQKAFGSVSSYRCPSRRSGGSHYSKETTMSHPGPQTDYFITAACYYRRDSRNGWVDTSTNARLLDYWMDPDVSPYHHGPFRSASVTVSSNIVESYTPIDSFAWWQDGTSNQVIVCEKHIPKYMLGKCKTQNYAAGTTQTTQWLLDCSYLSAFGGDGGVGRSDIAAHAWVETLLATFNQTTNLFTGRPIARSDSEPLPSGMRFSMERDSIVVGSAHPGSFNVLLGDGSVRGVTKNVNVNLLARMTIVDDGTVEQLP